MDETVTIRHALKNGRESIANSSPTAALDVQVLLAHLLDRPRAWILTHPEVVLPKAIASDFFHALQRLRAGEPLPYLLGRWEFYGRMFRLTPDVLIPRPETEMLIEMSLDYLGNLGDIPTIIDVGTGSGCIAITLAREHSVARIIATDHSRAALCVAQANAEVHQVAERILLTQCDLLTAVEAQVDLIVANLPYIPSQRLLRNSELDHEPRIALDGGQDGVTLLERLMGQLPKRLVENGKALLEIDQTQGECVIAIAQKIFPDAALFLKQDLAGLDRYVIIDKGNVK